MSPLKLYRRQLVVETMPVLWFQHIYENAGDTKRLNALTLNFLLDT